MLGRHEGTGEAKRRHSGAERNSKESELKERLLIMLTTRPKLTASPHTHTHTVAGTDIPGYREVHTGESL